jgi:hypothetical protein
MDFKFFENDIFCQILNMNHNKMVWRKILKILRFFLRIFFKYFPKSSKKANGCGSCYLVCTYWIISNAFHTIILLTTIDQLLFIQWSPQCKEGLVIGNCGKFCSITKVLMKGVVKHHHVGIQFGGYCFR